MSKPDGENPTESESYVAWLEACDQAIALGRAPIEPIPDEVSPEREHETLNMLRRLDGLRARSTNRDDRPSIFDSRGANAETGPDGLGTAAPGSDASPSSFGDYDLLEPIASGGMGIVYKAWQKSLNRAVAVKMIRLGNWASATDLRRFLREAENAAKLEHPHIVPVHEVGQVGGLPYYSMKLMEGGSLADRLGRQAESPRAAAILAVPIVQAVHHAHQHGVLHRDLKPANVLLDAEGRPSVGDFGLAREIEGDSSLTAEGAIVGTPSYMAPEQAAGGLASATIAADVYSLGAILYALLTGQPPFSGKTPVETLRQVIDQEPTSPRALNPKIDRDLEAICLKALDKQPRRRYPSASALAEDLERWLAGKPIRARRVGRPERLWKWARRHPAIAALSGTIVIVAAIGLIGMFVLYGQAVVARGNALVQAKKTLDALDSSEASLYSNRIALAERHRLSHDADRADALLEECPISLRDWEWRYLKRRSYEDVTVYSDHQSAVTSIALSRDGRYLVSVDVSANIRVRDRESGRCYNLPGLPERQDAIALSRDGQWMAVGGMLDAHKAAIKLWDTKSWTEVKSLPNVDSSPRAIAFSPDSRKLVAGLDDDMVRIWDITTETSRSLAGHRKAVEDVAFSPDGSLIASASRDTTIRIWDAETGSLRATLPHARPVFSVAFHPEGRMLASSTGDVVDIARGDLTLWDVASARVVQARSALGAMLTKVRFSPDGRRLATAGWDRVVRIWDATTLNELIPLTGHAGPVRCIAYSPNGSQLYSGGHDGRVRCWNGTPLPELSRREPLHTFAGHENAVYALALSADGRRLISAGEDYTVRAWDVATGESALTYRKHAYAIYALSMRGDGSAVASAGDDQIIRIWCPENGEDLAQLRGHTAPISSVAFHPDGVRLASGSQDGTVRLWDTRTGVQIQELLRSDEFIYSVAYSADGRLLAAGGDSGPIRVWDMRDGRLLHILRGHTQRVSGLAFHPVSDLLLSTSLDGTARLWESLSGHEISVFDGVRGRGLAWAPDDRHFAISGADGVLKVWEYHSGQRVLTLRGHTDDITSAVFSTDGHRIVTAGWDRTIKLWSAWPESADLWAGETRQLIGHRWRATTVAILPDGKRAISGGEDGTIRIHDIASGRELRHWVGSDFKVFRLAVSPDGAKVVVAGENSDVRLYEIESGRALGRFNRQDGAIFALAVTPDGRHALTGGPLIMTPPIGWLTGPDVDLHLWDLDTGAELRNFSGHQGGIWSVAISPDGRRAVSGSIDGTVRCWDLDTGAELHRIEAHKGFAAKAVAFLPDGGRVLSGGTDGRLCLWNIETGREFRRFDGARAPVEALAISPDGRHALSSGNADHHLRLWGLESGRAIYSYEVPHVSLTHGTFTPDGRQALWAGSDGAIRIWNLPERFDGTPNATDIRP
jgi:eukaryotic-like serine/threonine-protein kinase